VLFVGLVVVLAVELVVAFGFAPPSATAAVIFSSSNPLTYLVEAAFYSLTDFNKSFFEVIGLGFTSIFDSSLDPLALLAPGVAKGFISKVYLALD